jgi:heme a synthase
MAETRHGDRQLGIWLLFCCAVLLALIVLGAATRLTGSGLSIVHWQPITGIWPPVGETQWHQVFEQYRASPEYQQVNRGMSMGEFKVIFWYEYAHRLLARTLGLMFAIPLIWFWWRSQIPRHLRWPLVGLLALGLGQGYMGWYMVQSGLVDIPRVSPYRLAAHLGLALAIFAGMFWMALRLLWPHRSAHTAASSRVVPVLVLIVVTIISGAFVAGLKAGYLYNTFPMMGGQWVPGGLLFLEPAWRNFFENPVTVQFTHRLLGITTVIAAVLLSLWALRLDLSRTQRVGFATLAVFAVAQASLGIATLVLHMPVWLAATHQAGAVILLSTVLALLHLNTQPSEVAVGAAESPLAASLPSPASTQ